MRCTLVDECYSFHVMLSVSAGRVWIGQSKKNWSLLEKYCLGTVEELKPTENEIVEVWISHLCLKWKQSSRENRYARGIGSENQGIFSCQEPTILPGDSGSCFKKIFKVNADKWLEIAWYKYCQTSYQLPVSGCYSLFYRENTCQKKDE